MRIVLGADHAGYEMKQDLVAYVQSLGHEVLEDRAVDQRGRRWAASTPLRCRCRFDLIQRQAGYTQRYTRVLVRYRAWQSQEKDRPASMAHAA